MPWDLCLRAVLLAVAGKTAKMRGASTDVIAVLGALMLCATLVSKKADILSSYPR